MLINGFKSCPRCGESKLAEGNFYRINRYCGDGYAGYCISCTKTKVVAWQKANPEKKAAADKKQNQKPERKAKHAVLVKAWLEKHPEKNAEYSLAYRKRHPERAKESQAKFRKTEKFKASQWRYHQKPEWKALQKIRDTNRRMTLGYKVYDNARRLGGGTLTADEWRLVLDKFKHRCAYCHSKTKSLEIDHFIPYTKDGKHEIQNVVPACRSCNSSKKAKHPFDWVPNLDEVFSRMIEVDLAAS